MINIKHIEAMAALNKYDRSEKSAQDAQELIYTMEQVFDRDYIKFENGSCIHIVDSDEVIRGNGWITGVNLTIEKG